MTIRLNCNRSNADGRKLVDFVAKQRRVHAEYGFWLSAQRRTKEEEDGFRRYRKDYRRNYYREHYETERSQMKAYAASHRKTPTAEDAARQAAFEEKRRLVKEKYGFDLGVVPIEMTDEEREARRRYALDEKKKWNAAHKPSPEKRREYNARARAKKLRKQKRRERMAVLREIQKQKREEKRKEREEAERQAFIAEWGFDPSRAPQTKEEKRAKALYALSIAREKQKAAAEKRRALREARRAEKRKERLAEMAVKRERREAEEAARLDAERQTAALLAEEREANRAAYLAVKAAKKDEKEAVASVDRDTPIAPKVGRDDPIAPPIPPVPDVPSDPVVPSPSSGGNLPPIDTPPTITTGGEPPEDDGEDEVARREAEFRKKYLSQVRKAAAKKRKATIARKKREEAAQAAREAKATERAAQAKAREEERLAAQDAKRAAKEAEAAAKAERKALLAEAYKTFKYKITAYKRKAEKMRRHLKFPRDQQKWTPEQEAQWNDYLATSRKELDDWLVERMRKELGRSLKSASRDKPGKASISAELIAKRETREKRKQEVFEKYGFHLGKKPVTLAEIEGRKRYDRDMLAAERERHREKIREYQKLYRRRRRQQVLEEKQTKWTAQQWAAWEKKQASKERGSPQWLVKEVVKHLATEQNLTEEQTTARLIELGGLDFLIKGAESMGATRCRTKGAVLAAAHALALYLDPDGAVMFKSEG